MENNHDIKIVRFKDGLDVVCHFNYTSEDETMMELETPMMFEVRNTNLVMQNWLPLSLMKVNTVKIKTEEVLCLIEPSDEFAEYYHETVTKMNRFDGKKQTDEETHQLMEALAELEDMDESDIH